jgi:hypothetical protein
MVKLVFLDLPVNGRLSDAEQLGGLQAVAACHFKGLTNGVSLSFPQCRKPLPPASILH